MNRNYRSSFLRPFQSDRRTQYIPLESPFSSEFSEKLSNPKIENINRWTIPRPIIAPLAIQATSSTELDLLLNDFCTTLLITNGNASEMQTMMRSFSRDQIDLIYYIVLKYFHKLHTKLCTFNSNYCDLTKEQECLDFVSIGPPFWDWLVSSKLFSRQTLMAYSVVIHTRFNLDQQKLVHDSDLCGSLDLKADVLVPANNTIDSNIDYDIVDQSEDNTNVTLLSSNEEEKVQEVVLEKDKVKEDSSVVIEQIDYQNNKEKIGDKKEEGDGDESDDEDEDRCLVM